MIALPALGPAPAAPAARVGVVKFASCDGCQLTLLDLEDELLAITERFDIVEFPEATSRRSAGPYDVLLVEGSISTARAGSGDRRAAGLGRRLLVTIGACATAGGIQALRNLADHDAWRGGGLPAAGVRARRSRRPPRSPTTSRSTPSCAAARSTRPAARAADRAGDRPPAAAARRGGLRRVQAPRGGLRPRRPGRAVPRPGDADRLRRALPGLRARLLRLLRPAGAANVREPRRVVRRGRSTAVRGRERAVRRLHRLSAEPFRSDRRRPSAVATAARHVDRCRRGGLTRCTARHDRRRRPTATRPSVSRSTSSPGSRARARSACVVRDGEVVEAQLGHLRGAALLRAARRRPDAGRGPRHRRPHLRHLPGRLPDERRPRLRGRPRHRRRPGRPGAAPPPLLRRVDREPRAPHLPAPCPRLPGLPDRRSSWPRDHREVVERGLRDQADRQRDHRDASAGGRSTRSASGSAASRGCRALRRPRTRSARPSTRRSTMAQATVDFVAGLEAPEFDREPLLRLAPPPDRVPDERRAGSSRPTGSTSPLGLGPRRSRSSRSSGRTPSRRGPATARSTCSARRPGSPSPRERLHPLAARGARRGPGFADADPVEHPLVASSPGRSSSLHARPRRATSSTATSRRPSRRVAWTPGPGHCAWATEAPRGLLFHRYELDERGLVADRPDRAADEPEPGRDRGRPDRVRARRPRPAARRGDAPPRAAHPELRPVHLLCDPLPRPSHRARVRPCR